MQKIISLFLIITLCFTLTPNTASAAAIKISKANVTVEMGNSATLKISGTSKAVKWASNNKVVATVTSKGKVTAIAVGEATITATVNKKKYLCKITVNNGFNAKTAPKNIGAVFVDLNNGIVGTLTNNNKYPLSLTATAVFYDASGAMLGVSSSQNYYFESRKKCALYFSAPYDSNYNQVSYNSYKISYSVSDIDYAKSNLSNIVTESNIGIDNVMVKATNSGDVTSDSTQVCVIFYKNGKVIGYDYQCAGVHDPGTEDYLEFNFPYDQNYETIQIDNYEVFVNNSYYYTYY